MSTKEEDNKPKHVAREAKDGSGYVGGWLDGKAQGNGKYTWPDGSYYDGEWDKGLSHGFGELVEANGRKYKGDWVQDKQHGQGNITYPDGTTYEGHFKHGKKHGSGTMNISTGDVYVGEFENDKMHGQGKLMRSRAGFGCLAEFEGLFADGFIREGTFRSGNGGSYVGQFLRNGQQHGKGSYFNAGGEKEYEGYFILGKTCSKEEFDKYEQDNPMPSSNKKDEEQNVNNDNNKKKDEQQNINNNKKKDEKQGVNNDNVKKNVKAYVTDYKGNYPIYYLIHENRPAEEILKHIKDYSLTEKVLGSIDAKTGRTLLHTCCYRGDDIRIIRKLITFAPSSVLVKDNRGGYPLHSFCFGFREENRLDILYELMKAYPNAIKEKTNNGNTPLNLACWRGLIKLLPVLLAFDKTQLNVPNKQGEKPRDFVANNPATLHMFENIDQVINAFKATMLQSQSGQLMVSLIERVNNNTTAKGEELERAKKKLRDVLKMKKGQRWMRSKLMIVGEGRSGKTSTLRNLMGQEFRHDEKSTIGAKTDECIVNHFSVHINRLKSEEAWRSIKNDLMSEGDFDHAAAMALNQELGRGTTNSHQGTNDNYNKPINQMKNNVDKDTNTVNDKKKKKLQPPTLNIETSDVNNNNDNNMVNGTIANTHKKPLITSSRLPAEIIKNYGEVNIENLLKVSGDRLKLGVWDYGGQEIFYAIHHLFLTRFGVYLVLFDMQKLIDVDSEPPNKECRSAMKLLHFWLNSIALYGRSTFHNMNSKTEDKGSPILLIGSHKDIIKDKEKHREISEKLKLEFSNHFKDQKIIQNHEDDLCFFPVDNTDNNDEIIKRVRNKAAQAIAEESYIQDEYPMPWMKLCDELKKKSQEIAHLSFDEVCDLSLEVGIIDKEEVKAMLEHFHELGVVIYYGNREELNKLVILDPQWIVDRISDVIREFSAEAALHSRTRDQIAMSMTAEWADLTTRGILSKRLLRHLWRGDRPNLQFLLTLMQTFALIVPLKIPAEGSILLEYMVPNLLPSNEGLKTTILNKIKSEDSTEQKIIEISFKDFVPNGIFGRFLVVALEYNFSLQLQQMDDKVPPSATKLSTLAEININSPKNIIERSLSSNDLEENGSELYRSWAAFSIEKIGFVITKEKYGFTVYVLNNRSDNEARNGDLTRLCKLLGGLLDILNTEFYNSRLEMYMKTSNDVDPVPLNSKNFSWPRPSPKLLATPKSKMAPAYLREKAVDRGYYTLPDLTRKHHGNNEQDSSFNLVEVENFVVGRVGYGKIHWLKPLNLTNVGAIDDIIYIQNGDVSLYEFHEKEPAVGEELNNPARITFENVFPNVVTFKTENKEASDEEQKKNLARFKRRIQRIASKRNYKNNKYDENTGIWQFEVEHFSRHGYHGDDDDLVKWLLETLWPKPKIQAKKKEQAEDYAGGLIFHEYYLDEVIGDDPPSELVLVSAGIHPVHVKKLIRVLYKLNPNREDYKKLVDRYNKGGDVVATYNHPQDATSSTTASENQKPSNLNNTNNNNNNNNNNNKPGKQKSTTTIVSQSKTVKTRLAYDVFLSHDWGTFKCPEKGTPVKNHERVKLINEALKENGLVTWFDEEEMSGCLDDAMEKGISQSTCFLAFITENYMKKVGGLAPAGDADNCRREFVYAALKKQRPNKMMIPIVMDATQRTPAEWISLVAFHLGSDLYMDMSSPKIWDDSKPESKDEFKKCVSKLITGFIEKKIKKDGKTLIKSQNVVVGSARNAVHAIRGTTSNKTTTSVLSKPPLKQREITGPK